MINFIVNSRSGRGKGNRHLKKLIDYCYKNNIEYTAHITSAPGHATRIAKALCENNSHTIAAVGGDGTFHEVLNGITSFENVSLGFIPSGRGNDFARALGIPLNPIKALKNIVEGATEYWDYIQIDDKRCLNVAGTGLDIDVLQQVEGKQGKINYLTSLIYCLRHFDPYQIVVSIDGKEYEYEAAMAGVCNGKQIGGGIKIAPIAKHNDGILDVIVIEMPKDGKLFKRLPIFVRGKHMNMPETKHFTCESVHITNKRNYPVQLDGEIYNDLNFDCNIVKGGLKTFELKYKD